MPTRASFFAYVDESLRGLSEARGWADGVEPVTEAACLRARRILWSMGKPTSVFPSLAPDGGGGVSIAWMAGKQSVVVDVDADGAGGYARVTGRDGAVVLDFPFGPVLSPEGLGQALDRMSATVHAINPGWRSFFDVAPTPRHPMAR